MSYGNDLNFTFGHTPKVIFGSGCIADVRDALGEMGLERAVVITDKFLAEKTDLLDKLKKALGPRLAGVFDGVIPDPTAPSIDSGAELASSLSADCVISLGGGSAIDTAKGIAIVLSEGGKILDHEGYHVLPRPLTPHLAIPTTAGTGSEMTMVTVVKDPERRQKTFIGSYYLHPNLAVLDPELITGLPARLTAATGMDAMSHAVESLISDLRQPLSDAMALGAIQLLSVHLPSCLDQPDDLTARGQTLIAANLAGSAFSNAMCSLNHAMAHTVGARFGIHHGTGNAMFLPHTMRYFMDVSAEQFAQVGRAMGLASRGLDTKEAGSRACDHMEEFIADLGLTDRLHKYGISDADLPELAATAMTDGTIINGPRMVTGPGDIVELFRKVL